MKVDAVDHNFVWETAQRFQAPDQNGWRLGGLQFRRSVRAKISGCEWSISSQIRFEDGDVTALVIVDANPGWPAVKELMNHAKQLVMFERYLSSPVRRSRLSGLIADLRSARRHLRSVGYAGDIKPNILNDFSGDFKRPLRSAEEMERERLRLSELDVPTLLGRGTDKAGAKGGRP